VQTARLAGDLHCSYSGGLTILNAVSITQNRSNVNTDNGCLLCLSIMQRRLANQVCTLQSSDSKSLILLIFLQPILDGVA